MARQFIDEINIQQVSKMIYSFGEMEIGDALPAQVEQAKRELLNISFTPVILEWQSAANSQPFTKIECGIDNNKYCKIAMNCLKIYKYTRLRSKNGVRTQTFAFLHRQRS